MKSKQKIKKLMIYISVILLVGVICFFNSTIKHNAINMLFDNFGIVARDDTMLVHFISVGQGDACVIDLPDGKTMLIDTGLKSGNVSYTNYLEENVINDQFNRIIDYLVLTHADADHIGGTLRVLKIFKLKIYICQE